MLDSRQEATTMPTQRKLIVTMLFAFSAGSTLPLFAQEPRQQADPPSTGWRRFGDDPTLQQQSPQQQFPQQQFPQQQFPQQADQAPPPMPASALIVPAGTWVTVRVNQPLSTDHNQQGDSFTATLAQPIVANGRVIAHRGQTVAGVVADARKAGRVKGTSELSLKLTEVGLADGRQVPITTTMMARRGNTSTGTDAA